MTVQPSNPNLVEITTAVQRRRGNRQWFDTKHEVSYISYTNGYIRREIKAEWISTPLMSQLTGDRVIKGKHQFVLNRRVTRVCEYTNYKYRHLILEPSEVARIEEISRISSNYKGYTGYYTQPGWSLISK